jgi:hypothetical protein
MPFQPPGGGLNNTAEYMTSGLPWVSASSLSSGSVWQIDFPNVTNHLRIHLDGGNNASLAFGFTRSGSLGSNKNFLTATAQTSDTFSEHVRVKTIYIVALTNNVTASVFAGLTTISTKNFPILTGSAPYAFDPTGSVFEKYLSYADGTGLG